MKEKKLIPIFIAIVLFGVSIFSGCVGPWAIDTLGWEHMNEEGTAVRIWGQLTILQSSDNWNEGFYWDTEYHDKLEDYTYFSVADNHAGFGLFSLTIPNLNRTTTYHYRAYGEYLKAKNQIRIGLDNTFISGGPTTTTENASDIGLTSVTLKGTLWHLGGAPSCDVYFLYGTDPNALNIQTTPQTMTATGTFNTSLSDLIVNTTYYYKAVAKNDADTTSGFTLSVTPGQPVVVTRKPGDVGKDYAILKGELWHTGGTTECTVWFAYSDQSNDHLNQSTPPQTMNATGAFETYLGDLKPETHYWYRAIASNGLAQGKGEIYEFTTRPTKTLTPGVHGKPVKQIIDDEHNDMLSRISPRFLQLFEKYPMLLKLLQQPQIRALLIRFQY